jgi:WD40 repeat protein
MASQPMIVSEHPPRNVLSPSGRYKRTGTLLSHKQPILTLAISRNGKYIASGGKYSSLHWGPTIDCSSRLGIEGIKIWDLKSHKELPFPSQTVEQRGQVTCCTWITRSSDDSEVICYGTGLGYVVFLKEDGVSCENRGFMSRTDLLKRDFFRRYSRDTYKKL